MDMVLDTEPTDMDTHMPMVPMDTMERDLLMLSQRLMLIPISCTEDMALAMLDITDMLDTHTPMDTTERDLPEAKPKADADPYLLYGGYGLGYAGHYGYAGYPYTYGYYGKRSADAEPKADADPYLLYGGYGLGYAGHYGYAGYPYTYGYYGKRSADAEPKADADAALLYGAYGYGLGYRTYGYGYPYAYGA